MKISKEEIKAMKELREDGLTMREIGDIFGISRATVSYHVNDETKRKRIQKTIENLKKKSKEFKKKRYEKYKQKMIDYQNKKYKEDEEFRNKRRSYAREYYRRKNEKQSIYTR